MITMSSVNLRDIFLGLQQQMIARLSTERQVLQHPGAKGTATELHWLEMLNGYLPRRYCADKAFVLDASGHLSDEIDVVIYDRQYSPFLFNQDGAKFVPAESVYASLEVRQIISAQNITYAGEKAASVRKLRRTSAPIPHAGGRYEPRQPPRIIGGFVALDSDWSPPLGDGFWAAIRRLDEDEHLDVGCVLRHGGFDVTYHGDGTPKIELSDAETALIFFFVKLLARLQASGTVAALDYHEYGRVL